MTSNETFGRDLSRWLHEEGEHRVPDHLAEVLVATVVSRQRPWWSSPKRWLPMDTVMAGGRASNLRPVAIIAVIAALLIAMASVAIISNRPTTPPAFGLADNGRIFVASGATITSYDANGSDPRIVVEAPANVASVTVSPDGDRIAYYQGPDPGQVRIVTLDGGATVSVPSPPGVSGSDQIAWSSDSSSIVYPAFREGRELVVKAAADGSTAAIVGEDVIDPRLGIWWASYSPDHEWISFVGVDNDADQGTIFLIRPDGTGLHSLPTSSLGVEPGAVSWAPDPAVQRLLYTAVFPANAVRVFDVATGEDTHIADSWWPTWSPDAKRISFWGTEVVDTAEALLGTAERTIAIPPWSDDRSCQDHPELKDQNFCGPASWSPDGSRLIAPDITGTSILSVMADGTGQPMVIPLDTTGSEPSVSWQPIR